MTEEQAVLVLSHLETIERYIKWLNNGLYLVVVVGVATAFLFLVYKLFKKFML